MKVPKLIRYALGIALLAALGASGYLTREHWYGPLRAWVSSRNASSSEEAEAHAPHGSQDRLRLSTQALATLDLDVRPAGLRPEYWKSIVVPGQFTERPGRSDRGLATPVPGIVTEVLAVPGETVRPQQKLFAIRVISEHLQASQRELYQVILDQKINRTELARLEKISSAIPEYKLLELDYEYRRLQAKERSYRSEFRARGLSKEEIEGIIKGDFVKEITLHAPTPSQPNPSKATESTRRPLFDIQSLAVHPGDQVEAGQKLCILSEHDVLFLKGRVFKHEVTLVQNAMEKKWPVEMQLVQKEKKIWPTRPGPLKILYLGNEVEPHSQTVPVYVPLENDYIERSEDGKLFRTWRYRPSQRVLLRIPVERFENVFVLPTEAVVREGAENYVFQQNGSAFDRKEVRVLYRDRSNVVIANDGVLIPGVSHVATRGASQLQRALQIQQSSGNIDPHAGHMH